MKRHSLAERAQAWNMRIFQSLVEVVYQQQVQMMFPEHSVCYVPNIDIDVCILDIALLSS